MRPEVEKAMRNLGECIERAEASWKGVNPDDVYNAVQYIRYENNIHGDRLFHLVADDGLSFVSAAIDKGTISAFIFGLNVHESVRRRGRASDILKRIEDICVENGAQILHLNSIDEEFVLKMYIHRGYKYDSIGPNGPERTFDGKFYPLTKEILP